MVRHDLKSENIDLMLSTDLTDDRSKACLHLADEHPASVLRAPNEVVFCREHRLARRAILHMPMIPQGCNAYVDPHRPGSLDPQLKPWACARFSVRRAITENEPPPIFTDDERAAFLAWRSGTSVPSPVEPELGEAPPVARSLQQLANDLLVPEEFLDTVLTLLRERGQLILYGPPGTGKTYIARKLMEFIAPEPARHEVVQFHPSYSYEDFVEGYRPSTSDDGRLAYELRPGPLLRLAKAASASKHEHVLLIDEINRGNLPRILGELLYALEYRGEPIQLMYSVDDPLVLPRNLLVLGTMNTADKSIGLIDAALRRRFHFIPLFPGEGALTNLLSQWLDNNMPEMSYVARVVDKLNRKLCKQIGHHLQVGYSYFLRPDLSEEVLARIWEADILPFLEDQFFGHDEDLAAFQLEHLVKGVHEDTDAEGVEPAAGPADQS